MRKEQSRPVSIGAVNPAVEILSDFDVVHVAEELSLVRIHLDEAVKVEYTGNPDIESKGFCDAVTIRDFPIRDKGVDLMAIRCRWYDKQPCRYFPVTYSLKVEDICSSKETAAFAVLKGFWTCRTVRHVQKYSF